MTTTTATIAPPTRAKTVALWALRALTAAAFLFFASLKLTSQPMMVAEFGQIGLGQAFRYLTAALEVAGAVALLVPRVSVLGAILLLLVDVGAFVAQVAVLHVDWIHTVVIALILSTIIYLQRGSLAALRARL